MANRKHLAKLKEGADAWNIWAAQQDLIPYLPGADLAGADLRGANLQFAKLSGADLSDSDLSKAVLHGADLTGADLHGATLRRTNLNGADLTGANLVGSEVSVSRLQGAVLCGANLSSANLDRSDFLDADCSGADLSDTYLGGANLTHTNLSNAILRGADLRRATLVDTNLAGANLTDCKVFGISVWNVELQGTVQSNLLITPPDESPIQVDDLEVAQFIYLLMRNEKVRSVIDTITSKVVLILGRFTPERKVVLDAIRDELRKRDYLPVLFDFEKPASKSLTGTILTLANMAHFIIADLTDPSSVPYELGRIVPGTKVPVQTIILEGQREFAMFVDLEADYSWVLEAPPVQVPGTADRPPRRNGYRSSGS